jgi:hypothetical protein
MVSAWDCFHFATLELVRSAPIKQRLISAYRRHLAVIPEDQVPFEIRDCFGRVMNSLCGVRPLRGEDAVAASVRKMSNQEADECASMIVEMFGQISRAQAAPRVNATLVKLHAVETTGDEYEVPALTASN